MGYVKKTYIDGLKRFEHFEIEFNELRSVNLPEIEIVRRGEDDLASLLAKDVYLIR